MVDNTLRMLIYNKDELWYLIKVAMIRAREALSELKKAAKEYEVDLSRNENMQKSYQMASKGHLYHTPPLGIATSSHKGHTS